MRWNIDYILENEKLKLGFWDILNYYPSIIFSLITLPLMILSLIDKHWGSFIFISFLFSISLLGYLSKKRYLKFTTLKTNLDIKTINKIIKDVVLSNNWRIKEKKDNFIILTTRGSAVSWGEEITILFDKDRVLINSINDLDKKQIMVSGKRNKNNINKLVEAIEGFVFFLPKEK